MRFIIRDLNGVIRIDVRILEESGEEFRSKDMGDGSIQDGFGNSSLLYLVQQRTVRIDIRKFEINPGSERYTRSVFLLLHNVMARLQLWNTVVVGDNEALEPPFSAEHFI